MKFTISDSVIWGLMPPLNFITLKAKKYLFFQVRMKPDPLSGYVLKMEFIISEQ